MPEKMKFKPVVTQIKLNPEQAVLACLCYTVGRYWRRTRARSIGTTICRYNSRTLPTATWSTGYTGTAVS